MDVDAWAVKIRTVVLETYREWGAFRPGALLLATRDPHTGGVLATPTEYAHPYEHPDPLDFIGALTKLVEQTRALGVIWFTTALYCRPEADPEPTLSFSFERPDGRRRLWRVPILGPNTVGTVTESGWIGQGVFPPAVLH